MQLAVMRIPDFFQLVHGGGGGGGRAEGMAIYIYTQDYVCSYLIAMAMGGGA